jgi:predicted secreted hydrolase
VTELTRRRALLWLASARLTAGEFEYRTALPGYRYSFPRDHFEHPDFRTEWWYYTGNLHSGDSARFGFELVFFRQAQRRGASPNDSAWRIDDLYLAHLALSDIGGNRFRYETRLNRAGPGIAGASFERQRIWNGNWSSQWNGETQTLNATGRDFGFTLRLSPRKQPVIHGQNGVSQKASGPGRASHYVSFTRLVVAGDLRVAEHRRAVNGVAWMDHEWFTHQLERAQVGWDWFSVQMDNGMELMLFQLRHKDGSIDPNSSGTAIDPQGRTTHLARSDFTLTPIDYWTSPQTGARYPIRWRIVIGALSMSLECAAAIPAQELRTEAAGGPSYWEGAVTYSGSGTGVGYLEMTGYDKAVRLQ